jgi:hypothetical protein
LTQLIEDETSKKDRGLLLSIHVYVCALSFVADLYKEPAEVDQDTVQFPFDVMLAMGGLLECPDQGNVEFEFKNTPNGKTRRLYALNTLLSTRSSYYATSLDPH